MIKAKKQVSDNEKTEACASFAIGMHKGVGIRTIDTKIAGQCISKSQQEKRLMDRKYKRRLH
jgi:hypothetical protein